MVPHAELTVRFRQFASLPPAGFQFALERCFAEPERFLDGRVDVDRMAAEIDKSLYRNKA